MTLEKITASRWRVSNTNFTLRLHMAIKDNTSEPLSPMLYFTIGSNEVSMVGDSVVRRLRGES